MALNNYYFTACCDPSVIKTFQVEDTNFVIGDVVDYDNECYTYTGNLSIDGPDDTFTNPDYSGVDACSDCLDVHPCLYHFSACCVTSGLTFSVLNVDIPQPLNIGETWKVRIISDSAYEFDACAIIVTGITPSTIYSGSGYTISLTGPYTDCADCTTNDTSCCVSGSVDSVDVFYVDCCGNFVSGGTIPSDVCFDPNYPFSGFSVWGADCVVSCVSPTPTPTLTPTPTPPVSPTPSSTPLPCVCTQYELRNLSLTDTANFTYYDCYGFEQNDFIPPDSVYEICCCEGTLIVPSYVLVSLMGGCSEFNPSPTPTNTVTPSITPSITTTTTTFCDFDEYCLQTGLSGFTGYDGEYYSAGTYNDKYYYTGSTIPGYIFYDGDKWCLSDSLGGSCSLEGPSPSDSVCPDFNSAFFYTGVCITTTTTTNPCDIFDFEAYFDCDYTTTTTTIIPCSATSVDVTFSSYTTTTTTVCNVGGSVNMVRYTTTTTTPSITTTTTTLSVFFNGVVTYTLFEEEVTCPNTSYKFQDCEDNTIYYYTISKPEYLMVPIVPGQVIQIYINTYLKCVTFLGISNSSADSTLGGVVGILPDCLSC